MRNSFFGNSKAMKKSKKIRKTTVFAINWVMVITLVTLSLVMGCPNTVSGESGKTTIVPVEPIPPVTPGKAIITLDPADKTIKVLVKTSDGTPITVEGANETSIKSGELTELTAKNTQIVLKNGKIIYLYYYENRITAIDVCELSELEYLWCCNGQLKNLNVKKLTKLRRLFCRLNNLDASAFTAILDALPKRLPSDNAACYLFFSDSYEKNYQFTAPIPEKLKEAFYKAKKNNWAIKKYDSMFKEQDIVLPQNAVTGVTLDNIVLSLIEGTKGKLTATVSPANAINKTVEWISKRPRIASVDQEGNVTAKEKGSTEITVTTQDGGFTAKCIVTVEPVVKKAVLTRKFYTMPIKLTAKTKDGTPITVEGCNVTSVLSGTETTLNATGEQIILKGDITELLCSENSFDAIDVSCLTSLKKLECQKNSFTELNVSYCTALQELDCSRSWLTELNLQNCTSLQKLDCSRSSLTELNLQSCTSLQEANCSSNNLTKLNVSGLTSLKKLECQENKFTELSVSGCIALKEFDCHKNKEILSNLSLKGCKSLQKLNCSNSLIYNLNLQGCTSLQEVNFTRNSLTELNVSGLTSLQKLDCSYNNLTKLNVHGCTYLEELDCTGSRSNKLTKLDVSGLTSLKKLKCGNNMQLTELNVSGLTSLQELDCHSNNLTELNVSGLTSLQNLNCHSNKLGSKAFKKIFADLPDRNGKDSGECCLYTENGYGEDNYKYFTDDELNVIKVKNWIPYKIYNSGIHEDL